MAWPARQWTIMAAYVRGGFAGFAADYISLHYRPLPLVTWSEPGGSRFFSDADQADFAWASPWAGMRRKPGWVLARRCRTRGPWRGPRTCREPGGLYNVFRLAARGQTTHGPHPGRIAIGMTGLLSWRANCFNSGGFFGAPARLWTVLPLRLCDFWSGGGNPGPFLFPGLRPQRLPLFALGIGAELAAGFVANWSG